MKHSEISTFPAGFCSSSTSGGPVPFVDPPVSKEKCSFASLEEMDWFAMLRMSPINTGLPMCVYFCNRLLSPYGPTMKVQTDYRMVGFAGEGKVLYVIVQV